MASVPASRLPAPPSKPRRVLLPRISAIHHRGNPHFPRSYGRVTGSSGFGLCRCSPGDVSATNDGDPGRRGLDSLIQDFVRNAVKRWDDFVNSHRRLAYKDGAITDSKEEEEEEEREVEKVEREKEGLKGEEVQWDWERWKRHFAEVEEQERVVAALKSQLGMAIAREEYEEAANIKNAITSAIRKDAVGSAISDLKIAIAEEQYADAAFLRDHAGVGLVGWWSGISTNAAEPYGQIICISAEHGRYLARSYSSRQLSAARQGSPLFEVFFTVSGGEYKNQAVYLKQSDRSSGGLSSKTSRKSNVSSLNPSDSSTEEQSNICVEDITAVEERDDNADMVDGLTGIQNVLRDMIPGVKVKVLKVVAPGKVDRDLIAKVIEQIMEDNDEVDDEELESLDADDSASESDIEEVIDYGDVSSGTDEQQPGAPVKLVIGTLMQNLSADLPPKDLVRVPAVLERKDHGSFSFSVQQTDMQHETDGKEPSLGKNLAIKSDKQSAAIVMSDLAKVLLSKEKIPMKVLKDIGELISSSIKREQNQPFFGTMLLNRIEIPSSTDPLSGLYVGANGMYASEVIHLKRKFGQWQENDGSHGDLEFYEYVEAVKLTGGLSIPAGQVVFRVKVGKRNQLPHKGIIPEEFGVVARFKGQGRVVDPGFQSPRWVDGELVVLDGELIKGGLGFVFWAPEFHFLVFFNRLKLPET